jgi:hypothetical protein
MASRSGGEAPVHSRYFQAAEFPLIFGCCSDVNSLIGRKIRLIGRVTNLRPKCPNYRSILCRHPPPSASTGVLGIALFCLGFPTRHWHGAVQRPLRLGSWLHPTFLAAGLVPRRYTRSFAASLRSSSPPAAFPYHANKHRARHKRSENQIHRTRYGKFESSSLQRRVGRTLSAACFFG